MVVSVRDEKGARLAETGRPTGSMTPLAKATDAATFPMLSSIDPYGRTIFNRIQMMRVTEEVRRLIQATELTSEDRSYLEKILEFCALGTGKLHRYLWFVGD
jgi:hypothetical protein